MKRNNLVCLVFIFGLIILYSGFVNAGFDPGPICGNGILDEGEECDTNDTEKCHDCNYTYLGDGIQQCQNGEGVCEECDGTDLGGESCESQGYDSGSLSCDSGSFDTSECYDEDEDYCGNGVIDDGEDCDDGNDVDDDDCPSDCTIEIRVYLDPKYIDDTEKNRNFRPDKITPFDDIICEVDKSWEGALGRLFTQDDSGEWSVVVATGVFENGGKWRINGWDYDGSNDGIGNPSGWNVDGSLVDQVVKTEKVKCVATRDGEEISVTNEELGKNSWVHEYSNCVHVLGNNEAKYPIAIAMAKSFDRKSSRAAVSNAIFGSNAFGKIDPFGAYPDVLSYFADLREVNDVDGISLVMGVKYIKTGNNNIDSVPNEFITSSSCGADKILLLFNGRTNCGYSWPNHGGRFVAWGAFVSPTCREMGWSGVVHEFGHNIGDLEDEYDKRSMAKEKLNAIMRWAAETFVADYHKNCIKPTYTELVGYNFYWGSYGDNNWKNCEIFEGYFRPSEKSIMNEDNLFSGQFNVVSCGYLLQRINGCSPIENCWDQCMNPSWNTIKP